MNSLRRQTASLAEITALWTPVLAAASWHLAGLGEKLLLDQAPDGVARVFRQFLIAAFWLVPLLAGLRAFAGRNPETVSRWGASLLVPTVTVSALLSFLFP
ncbi:MAG: hypothetical protein GMKNLPBB_00500 [Myxococcota bacterium]|nr:hypothetical protein [Myxococcota bacterium]